MLPSQRRLLVLDDDPTGSQCVHDVTLAFDDKASLVQRTLAEPASTCFVLTNTRALDQADAISSNKRILENLLKEFAQQGISPRAAGLHPVSRSDSTLRGHVIAEPNALADVLEAHGVATDAFLFAPAMLEAGRFTQNNIHYAMLAGRQQPVADTDFAQDASFGYKNSQLDLFLEEVSQGQVSAGSVLSISLEDIRQGGVARVKEILSQANNRQWVIINATEYSDLNTVADAVTLLEAQGKTFISRCGPSFVRSLAGQLGPKVLDDQNIFINPDSLGHGLVVVGSHVSLTSEQLEVLRQSTELSEQELVLEKLLHPQSRKQHIQEKCAAIEAALATKDVVLYTSRQLVKGSDPAESLAIARSVSDAVVELVQRLAHLKLAWVVAKGGITSHEVARRGLGIDLARVAGQFYAGQISLMSPLKFSREAGGAPYIVFPGNVGDRQALADVVGRLQAATQRSQEG